MYGANISMRKANVAKRKLVNVQYFKLRKNHEACMNINRLPISLVGMQSTVTSCNYMNEMSASTLCRVPCRPPRTQLNGRKNTFDLRTKRSQYCIT